MRFLCPSGTNMAAMTLPIASSLRISRDRRNILSDVRTNFLTLKVKIYFINIEAHFVAQIISNLHCMSRAIFN